MFKKKPIERKCKNCKLFDPQEGICKIVVLFEGRRTNVPMEPEDTCMYEHEYFDPTTKAIETFSEDIKEVKFWVENEKGEKTAGDGTVKMEYPEGFFGEKDPFDLENDEEYKRFIDQIAKEADQNG